MGATLFDFGQTSPKRLPKHESGDRHVGLRATLMEFMMLKCLYKANKKVKKKQLLPQEKLLENMSQVSTLEDWLLASPCLNQGCTSGGDFNDFKGFSSTRVFPSLATDHIEDFNPKFRESFSVEKLVKVDEADRGKMVDSLRSQNGKTEKKVRFRLPEVADIIIFDSSQEYFEE